MYSQEDVSIIIPHYGMDEQQERALDCCLPSLRKTTSAPVIMVKNGEHTCHHAADIYIGRQGQNGAVNAAAACATTAWIFVTNDDMVFARGWLEKLLETARRYNVACVSPNLVEPRPGAPPFLVEPLGGAGGDFNKEAWESYAEKHEDKTLEQGFNLPFLIRKDLWDIIGGYDVAYDPWGSNGDSDLQAKIILAGADTFRDRNVIVYHFSQTSGTFHPDNQEYWNKNWEYFKEKWGFERQGDAEKVWYSREIIDDSQIIFKPLWKNLWKKTTSYGKVEIPFNKWKH